MDLLGEQIQKPMFQMGAGLFSSASNGEDIGTGLLAGTRAAGQATRQQQEAMAYRKKQEAEQRQQEMWAKLSQGGQPPEWAKGLPPGMLDMAMSMGPEQGSQLVTQMMLKNSDRDLDIRRLDADEKYKRESLALERQKLGQVGQEKIPIGYRSDPNVPGGITYMPGGPHDPNTPSTAIQTDGVKALQAFRTLDTALEDYEGMINGKTGKDGKTIPGSGVAILPGQEKDSILQARRNIQLHAKELFNLGVLNGPDMMLMDQMLVDPTVNGITDLTNMYDTSARTKASVASLRAKLRDATQNKLTGAHQRLMPQETPQQPQGQQGGNEPKQAPDGNYYVPDPSRPGKYLQVMP